MRYVRLFPLSLAFLAIAGSGMAADLRLELPVICQMGTVCTIQNYFDHDPSPDRMDFACGRLSYDGHDGTDIRVPDLPTMDKGVPVVAAAPGVVKGLRDGMPDINVRKIGKAALTGRYAGNGVVIDHGDDWVTQYSHLKNGSVSVHKGERVEAGQKLGLIGMSGSAEFPHVEFSVRYKDKDLDPFVGLAAFKACGDSRQPLWTAAALQHLDYQATGPLIAGFATVRPDADTARAGGYDAERLDIGVGALVMWVDLFGTMKGDTQRFRIDGPDGGVIHEGKNVLDASNVSWFAFSGVRKPGAGWAPGTYRGVYALIRNGKTVVSVEREIRIGGDG